MEKKLNLFQNSVNSGFPVIDLKHKNSLIKQKKALKSKGSSFEIINGSGLVVISAPHNAEQIRNLQICFKKYSATERFKNILTNLLHGNIF